MDFETFEKGIWKKRWKNTCGYLFAEDFVKKDIINARIRYGMDIDENTMSFISGLFPDIIKEDQFWGAVASEKDDLYGGKWNYNLGKGFEFKRSKMIEVFLFGEGESKSKAAKFLLSTGMRSNVKYDASSLPKLVKKEKKLKEISSCQISRI